MNDVVQLGMRWVGDIGVGYLIWHWGSLTSVLKSALLLMVR